MLPIPTILVWSGLFFLLLAFVSKLGGFIEVQPNQKRPAIIVGGVLLVAGLFLNLIPISTFSSNSKVSLSDPEKFIIEYYSIVNKRDYDKSWSLLSNNYKNCSKDTLKKYLDFWRKIEEISVIDTKNIGIFNEKPVISASLRLVRKDGVVSEAWSDLQLTKSNNQWMIDARGECINR